MPHIRTAISSWDARNCDPALELIEAWMPLLSSWLLDNILNQLVVTFFKVFLKLFYNLLVTHTRLLYRYENNNGLISLSGKRKCVWKWGHFGPFP